MRPCGTTAAPASDFEDPVPRLPGVETVTTPGPRPLTTFDGTIVVCPAALADVRSRALGISVNGATVWIAALSDVDPSAADADVVRPYLDRLAVRCGAASARATEPETPLHRHNGGSREGVWSQ